MISAILDDLFRWVQCVPAAAVSAALFYGGAALLLFPGGRLRLAALFSPPVSSTGAHLAPLDAFRGLAALLVALTHCWQWPYPAFPSVPQYLPWVALGHKSVPIFVMLSGFLIFRSAQKIESAADVRNYARRRFLRIYPAYALAVALLFLIGGAELSVSNLLNELFAFRAMGGPKFLNPATWSLYVEMLFYAVTPVFVVVAGRHAGVAAITLYIAMLYCDPQSSREFLLWRYFFAGIAVSCMLDSYRRPDRWIAMTIAGAGAILLYADFRLLDWGRWLRVTPNDVHFTVGLAVGFALLMYGAVCSSDIGRVCGLFPLRYLAAVSYSLFLIHPVYLIACFPQMRMDAVGQIQKLLDGPFPKASILYFAFVLVPGAFAWATCSYLLVERPFLVRKTKCPAAVEPPVARPRLAA